jgi:rhodanese-related sulfurtransferase
MLVEQAGYTRVYNVTDGIKTWIKNNNPVIK